LPWQHAVDGNSGVHGTAIFRNSVFNNVGTVSDPNVMDWGQSDYNGFYNSPQFGDNQKSDDQNPFAPTGYIDNGTLFIYYANGQGAYYLRDGSPFIDAGTLNIDSTLKNDLAKMTTTVPQFFIDDVNSSMTLSQQPIRDTDTPDLGYHYPAVDYVLNGATVNNCTLNIDQGAVLAFEGYPYTWALRLNPGGRLNVNGVPTNRVVFAHLEAIQESPFLPFGASGPMITWRNLYFQSGPVTPFSEATVHYADFLTLSGGYNAHFDPIDGYLSLSYSIVDNLDIDGCLFQGGWLDYDDGGPQGRTLNLRNTVFDRCDVGIYDSGGYGAYFVSPEFSAQVNAVNNLFYKCAMFLYPVPAANAGDSWTFTDNIFDDVLFFADPFGLYNGPVGINNHNAYVGMSAIPNGANRLSPAAPSNTDPDLASLVYSTGPLGSFYLPTTATALIHTGSRSAASAGLYHFTSLTSNTKEATSQVNIGPTYLALISGKPADSNNDGVPDFLADRNGNGVENVDEMPWQSPNNGSLVILSPADGLSVGGIIKLRVGLGGDASDIKHVSAFVDGGTLPNASGVDNPAKTISDIEIDTRYLNDGTHTFSVRSYSDIGIGFSTSGQTLDSHAVTLTIANQIKHPAWQNQAQLAVNVTLNVPPTLPNYTIWFFNAYYPKAEDPFSPGIQISYRPGLSPDGNINYSDSPSNLGYGDGNTDPTVYSITELTPDSSGGQSPATTSQATVNPNISQDLPYPCLGLWVASYDDETIDYAGSYLKHISDHLDLMGNRWRHDDQLNNGWLTTGGFANNGGCGPLLGTLALLPDAGSNPRFSRKAQTWPLRGTFSNLNREGFKADWLALFSFVRYSSARNFYGLGHGNPDEFMYFSTGEHTPQRYRFVFLDGCDSYSYANFSFFGAVQQEIMPPPSGSGNAGFDDITFYASKGLRPAAFVGNTQDEVGAYRLDSPEADPTTGLPCDYRNIEATGNWHGQFLFYWIGGPGYRGLPLDEAKQQADFLAWGPLAGVSVPPDSALEVGLDSGGNPIIYSPITCLKITGYLHLHFNQYNHCGDWTGDVCQ
jgi:hypothetical protein